MTPQGFDSVVDILTRTGSVGSLPPAPVFEDSLPELDGLPKVYTGQGEQMTQWASGALLSHIAAGQAKLRKQDFTGARTSFDIARMIDPRGAEPRVGMIQTSLLIGNYHRATQMIRELGRRSPEVFATRFDIPKWHETQEQYDEFLRRFRQQVADTSKAGEMTRVLLGYVAWTNGDREQALNHLRLATDMVPQEQAWVNMIRVLESPSKTERPVPGTKAARGAGPPL